MESVALLELGMGMSSALISGMGSAIAIVASVNDGNSGNAPNALLAGAEEVVAVVLGGMAMGLGLGPFPLVLLMIVAPFALPVPPSI